MDLQGASFNVSGEEEGKDGGEKEREKEHASEHTRAIKLSTISAVNQSP